MPCGTGDDAAVRRPATAQQKTELAHSPAGSRAALSRAGLTYSALLSALAGKLIRRIAAWPLSFQTATGLPTGRPWWPIIWPYGSGQACRRRPMSRRQSRNEVAIMTVNAESVDRVLARSGMDTHTSAGRRFSDDSAGSLS